MGKNRRSGLITARDLSKLARLENPFKDVPLPALDRYRRELTNEMMNVAAAKERLRLLIGKIDESVNDRNKTTAEGVRVRITDHAVLRYLERYKGLNTAEVEDDLLDMLEDGRPEVAVRDGIIATVLPEGCTSLEQAILKGLADVGDADATD